MATMCFLDRRLFKNAQRISNNSVTEKVRFLFEYPYYWDHKTIKYFVLQSTVVENLGKN